ncbi:MAG TPA: DUF167 domain-containing protein [Candidatus Omnitrophota bacterium]|nr:DUF167 domain-containing protein [Candidatus Omnitrophota bacterium]HQJ15917.1 DUF167 domain-containing protein [Candidatus Omnitrophota bacterium]
MIISVRVSPRSSRARVQEAGGVYKVHCTRPAVDGQANEQVIELLADYLNVKKYRIRIVRGATSKTKFVEISDA